MNLKQLFCDHVWKEIKEEELGTIRINNGWRWPNWSTYERYGVTKVCLKCKKEKIVERRRLVI